MACLADGRMDIIVCTKKVRNGSCVLDLPTVENKEERKKEEGKKQGCRLVSSFDLVSSRLLGAVATCQNGSMQARGKEKEVEMDERETLLQA